MYTYLYIRIYIYLSIYIFICTYLNLSIYRYICTYMCVCVYYFFTDYKENGNSGFPVITIRNNTLELYIFKWGL